LTYFTILSYVMVAANGIPSPSPAIKGFTIVTTGKLN